MADRRSFRTAYAQLERRMRARAAADRDVHLPGPGPTGHADYVLIGMEPSLGPLGAKPRRDQLPDRSRVPELPRFL